MTHIIPTTISKTALDSLHAKLSAVDAGWLDGGVASRDNDDADEDDPSNVIITSQPKTKNTPTHTQHPIHIYAQLLQQIHSGIEMSQKRRQTPLVNAGYAARMATMTYVLERWIDSVIRRWVSSQRGTESGDESNNVQYLNVVLLGCGLDALGVWSKYVLKHSLNRVLEQLHDVMDETPSLSQPNVKVYEFDAWDNCVLKQQALEKSGLLQLSTTERNERVKEGDNSCCLVLARGSICLDGYTNESDESDYILIALDLRDTVDITNDNDGDTLNRRQTSTLSTAARIAGLDTSQPTIVLSELVLAYLGYEGTNAVMHSISNDLIDGNNLSLFACLEPVFPVVESDRDDSTIVLSVEESYARDYSRQFLRKLQRGKSINISKPQANCTDSSLCLHPLGTDEGNIKRRLGTCGLVNVSFATLREAVTCVARAICTTSTIGKDFLIAKEPFDEHAALLLNLGCYGVVCSFPTDINQSTVRDICPWHKDQPISIVLDSGIQVKPISSSSEDNQVRELYGRLYQHLYCTFPAIRKMVKSALKNDLLVESPFDVIAPSVIRDRFQIQGGEFWVAVHTNNADNDSQSTVVGCVGIRRRISKTPERDTSSTVTEYEIQRLAVDDSHRGKGIGKCLLRAAEDYALQCLAREEDGNAVSSQIKLCTTTPECLVAANALYEASGYARVGEYMAGVLPLHVYTKTMGLKM